MQSASTSPDERYGNVVQALLGMPDVTLGAPGKKGFGSSALQINEKIFAMLVRGRFVVKLPRERVDALVAAEDGDRFDPGHGRLMKEWLCLAPASEHDWLLLAKEAMAFVAARR